MFHFKSISEYTPKTRMNPDQTDPNGIFINLHSRDGVQSTWPSYLDSRSQVKGFTLEFHVCSISPESFWRFSLNFTQMFLSVRLCAEPMTPLDRFKVKVTLNSHGIYPSILCQRNISYFIKLHTNVPLSEVVCRTNDSVMQTQGLGHTSRSRN